jgi:hypothetical protein
MSLLKFGLVISFVLWVFFFSSDNKKDEVTFPELSKISIAPDSVLSGKQLASQYCSSCHLFPEPALLDKRTWVNSVLPNMGYRMGINLIGRNLYEDLQTGEEKLIRALNIYPETAMLSVENWKKIVSYYEKEAPDEPLPQKASPSVISQLPLFKAQQVFIGNKPFPQTTLLKYDKANAQLYVGDDQNILYVLDSRFQQKDNWWIESAAVDMDFPTNAAPRLLTIGVLRPSEQKAGRLMSLIKTSSKAAAGTDIHGLPRPVQFTSADLNMDGKEDAVIAGFGNHSGKLFWLDGFNPEKEHVLKSLPGARKVEIADFNRDKKPDLMVLMAQAREELSIFYNMGKGEFKEKVLLQFPPSFGAIYFELADFNKDGFQDIILTNGDNWDYSPIRKNYHGVHIYLNDGKDNFKEDWFYPLYGASKAVARDFDGDGDLDIAATSFYTDLDNPEQGFMYLSNEGNLNFKPFSTPEGASGKWMTMEAADYDQDGDEDIILGSYFHNVSELSVLMFKGTTSFPQLLVLENKSK